MPRAAADRVDEAIECAARAVSVFVGKAGTSWEVLHRSNNVVARFAGVVVKVSTDVAMAERDVTVASHVSDIGGPAVPPLRGLIVDGDFAISLWPYVPDHAGSEWEPGEALRAVHRALVGIGVDLPRLGCRFEETAAHLADPGVTRALDAVDRSELQAAVDAVEPATVGDAALHGEPHDRNRLRRDGRVVFIDFEAAAVGPIEWDLAFIGDDAVRDVWPDHDRALRDALKVGVSACVSAACWRHVSARPADAEMRWHAEHHLEVVRRALT